MNNSKSYILWLLVGYLIAGNIFAAEHYQIELIVIENIYSTSNKEYFPASSKQVDLNKTKSLARFNPLNSTKNGVKTLPGACYQLHNIANMVKHSHDYRLIYHTAWEQPLKQNHYCKKVYVNDKHNCRVDGSAIEGVLTIKPVGSLFYAKLDFILNKSNCKEKSTIFRLKDNGRLKQKELYYFDHPKFGLFVMIKPINEMVID